MGHVALYREWRPKNFDDFVEQPYVVSALRQAAISGNIGHAYLFSGTRGTGKTSMALIFSRAINCLSPENGSPCNKCSVCTGILNGTLMDVIEMDAASNNNVDTIRRICDEVIFTPSVAKYKVYIIDEVHMLSQGAFNALLKTLEEPPAHAVFILATTEPHRIPATILSRCQRYEFRRIPINSIIERIRLIAESEHTEIDDEALLLIARLADGALRDAISLFDQAKGTFPGRISREDILSLVGMVNDDFMYDVALSIVESSPVNMLANVEKFILEGRDVMRFAIDLAGFFRNVMLCKVSSDPSSILNVSDKALASIVSIASSVSLGYVIRVIRELSSLSSELKWSMNPRITLEISLIKLMDSIESNTPSVPEASSGKVVKTKDPAKPENTLPVESKPSKEDVVVKVTDNKKNENVSNSKGSDSKVPDSEHTDNTTIPADNTPLATANKIKAIADFDTTAVWKQIMDHIVNLGQMTVYLFAMAGKPEFSNDTITLVFEDKDQMNFMEISMDKSIKIIQKSVQAITGREYKVVPILKSSLKSTGDQKVTGSSTTSDSDKPSSPNGIEALKKSAEELGIAFYMEE